MMDDRDEMVERLGGWIESKRIEIEDDSEKSRMDKEGKKFNKSGIERKVLKEKSSEMKKENIEIKEFKRMDEEIGIGKIMRGKKEIEVFELDFRRKDNLN